MEALQKRHFQAVSLARDFVHPEVGSCVDLRDITFLHIEGHRETTSGLEYQFVGKMWLQAEMCVPFNLLQAYTREVTRRDRLTTLRIRKRTSEEVDIVESTGYSTRKEVRRA